jgi:hypothetical protein
MPVTKKEIATIIIVSVVGVMLLCLFLRHEYIEYNQHQAHIIKVEQAISQDDSRMLSSHADEAIANQQRMLAEAAKELECVRRTDGVLICRNRFVTTVAQSEVNCKITKTTADMVCEYKRK